MEKNNNKEKVKNKNELTNNKTAVMEQDSEKDKLYPDTLAQTKLVLAPYRGGLIIPYRPELNALKTIRGNIFNLLFGQFLNQRAQTVTVCPSSGAVG